MIVAAYFVPLAVAHVFFCKALVFLHKKQLRVRFITAAGAGIR
jgi:hypothetical protein